MIIPNSGPHIARIEKLEDELQIARDRIRELESALGIGDDIIPLQQLGLSPQEARLVNLVRKRELVTKQQMRLAVYADDPERVFEIREKTIDVVAYKARKKLRQFGVTFGSRGWGTYGIMMPSVDKARLAELMRAA